MGIAVCNSAQCMCSFGAAPCPLTVISNTNILTNGQPLAVVTDIKPINLSGFGMCSSMANPTVASATAAAFGVLTPQPCVPVISSPFIPGSLTVLVKGSPVLTNDSKTFCAYAGIITITSAGNTQVIVK